MLASLRRNAEATVGASDPLDGVETSLELLDRVRAGDRGALERLCAIHLPAITRWASGRLPRWARDLLSTDDLVQETVFNTLQAIGHFEPRREGALQAYLRQAVYNRIQDEVRRVHRRPHRSPLDETELASNPSPLEEAVGRETLERYEGALARLRAEDREAIVARVELGLSYREVAASLGKPSEAAAQMAVSRALMRLAKEMGHER
ncbi:MAG TPA: sigma-70 family RNA polymerase sigma factor [Candidatus Polarisedimenticolaceae bacterium]|nr:sigma-70 family RNA polymerase sigma factor [Candidatus Polarisedimenticolaceae bacterium]